ncbi:MAG: CapA family protein [Patescibacteria group bacterium]|nr:CapA family protein [Patescibacteria group bacterium]
MNLLFVGDIMLGRLVNDALKQQPPEYPWGDTLNILNEAFFRICNLECVISDRGKPWTVTPKVFHFRTDTKNIEVLKTAGINMVSFANNHILDFGNTAMLDTLKTLKEAGIWAAGSGKNLFQASRPITSHLEGKRISLIAFTDNEPAWEATKEKPGIFYVPINLKDARADFLLEVIQETKKTVDFLIVSAHWGPNWGYTPPPEHIPFAHALIEAGSDVVFGHSGHVFRGIEIYRNKPIIYGAGNFIDDYAVDEIERNDQSFIFTLETNFGEIFQLKLYPTIIADFQARLAKDREAHEIALKMQELCAEFKTAAEWNDRKRYLEITL